MSRRLLALCLGMIGPALALPLLAAALLPALLVPAPAGAVELVVVDARNTALQPGQSLDGNKPLQLEPNARVKLIASNGATLSLKGPYNDIPAPDTAAVGGDVVDALKQLVTRKESGASTLGAIRSGLGDREPPDPSYVDVTRSGTRCLMGERVVMWRPEAAGSSAMRVQPADGSWNGRMSWPAGTDRLALPERFALADQQTYLFDMDGSQAAITVARVPASLKNDQMRAAWMLDKGCQGQATALVRTVVR